MRYADAENTYEIKLGRWDDDVEGDYLLTARGTFTDEVRTQRNEVRTLRMSFSSDYHAIEWFKAHLIRPGGDDQSERTARVDRLEQLDVDIKAGLVQASLDFLTTGATGEPLPARRWTDESPMPWVPRTVGPGILVNDRNGHSLAFEEIRFAKGSAEEGDWVLPGRTIRLVPIGGPEWRLELLAPPFVGELQPGAWGTGLVLETQCGTLRTRLVTGNDVALLTRLQRGRDRLAPPHLATEEVEDLLRLAAQAGARVRMAHSGLDLEAYRKEVRDIEAFEVLLDATGQETVGLRHRVGRARGGSTVRVASWLAWDGWLDPDESLIVAAEQGWTRNRTRAVRPRVAHLFTSGRPLARWFLGLAEEGVEDWAGVDDAHRLGALEAAMASIDAVRDADMEEAAREAASEVENDLRESVLAEREAKLRELLAAWRESTDQPALDDNEMVRLIGLIDPTLRPFETATEDEHGGHEPSLYDLYYELQSDLEWERQYESQLELAEEWNRWCHWVEDEPDDAACPIDIDELIDRVAPFASLRDEDDDAEDHAEDE